MSDNIKGKIIFTSIDSDAQRANIKNKEIFDYEKSEPLYSMEPDLEFDSSLENEGKYETLLTSELRPRRSIWRRVLTLGGIVLLLAFLFQMVQGLLLAWEQKDWSHLLFVSAGFLIIIAALGAIVNEWCKMRNLSARSVERDNALQLLSSHDMGEARPFCEKLIRQSQIDPKHPMLLRWQDTLESSHNDKEVLGLYAKMVQPIVDKRAHSEISRYAAESALMIAVSPFALIDMAFIAWRNIRMINRIAYLYGIELGSFSRMRLYRLILLNVAFTGATELIKEVGLDWMSQDILAKLSARAAQGIGAGLLTARLGVKAMELCRPVPWLENEKPKLRDFRKELVNQLKKALPKKEK